MRLAIANDMKRMTEDIAVSHHERQKAIVDMRQNVGDMLKGFQQSHEQMSVDLKKGLREFNNARIEMNNAFKEEVIAQVRDLKSDVMKRLEDYGADMAEAKNIWASLTESQKGIKHKAVAPKRGGTIKKPTPVEEAAKEPTPSGEAAKELASVEEAVKEPTLVEEVAREMVAPVEKAVKGKSTRSRSIKKA
jgi:hypothetical protein